MMSASQRNPLLQLTFTNQYGELKLITLESGDILGSIISRNISKKNNASKKEPKEIIQMIIARED